MATTKKTTATKKVVEKTEDKKVTAKKPATQTTESKATTKPANNTKSVITRKVWPD